MAESLAQLKLQLQQLKGLAESGVLSPTQFQESEALLKTRILDLVLQDGTPSESAKPGPGKGLLLALGAGIAVLAAAGYAWKGSPSLAMGKPEAAMASSASGAPTMQGAATAPHTTNFDAISAMVDKLAARLKENPKDAEGWAMLGRSYGVLGKHPEALAAYEKAVALRKDDATLLADYADSLAMANGGNISGKPLQQIERALKLEPKNIKALFLAGTHAFDTKDYKTAVKYWDTAVQAGPADNPFVQQMSSALAEARSLAGLPPQAAKQTSTP